jgi:DHA2 family multidrug resistance protein
MTGPDTNTQGTRPVVTTHPLLGVAGVLLGALIATCTGRLMSVGLADIRGALHLGVDEGSRINTAFNASMMFVGPFSVYLVVSFMSKVPTQYRQVTAAPVEAK